MLVDDKHAGLLVSAIFSLTERMNDAIERYKKTPDKPYAAETITEYEAKIKILEDLKKFFAQTAFESRKKNKEVCDE